MPRWPHPGHPEPPPIPWQPAPGLPFPRIPSRSGRQRPPPDASRRRGRAAPPRRDRGCDPSPGTARSAGSRRSARTPRSARDPGTSPPPRSRRQPRPSSPIRCTRFRPAGPPGPGRRARYCRSSSAACTCSAVSAAVHDAANRVTSPALDTTLTPRDWSRSMTPQGIRSRYGTASRGEISIAAVLPASVAFSASCSSACRA